MSKDKKFFERFRQLRDELGESQEEYARRFGISRNYVGMIENGRDPGETFHRLFNLIEKQWQQNRFETAMNNGGESAHDDNKVREEASGYETAAVHLPDLAPAAMRRLIAASQSTGIPLSDLLNLSVHSYIDSLPDHESFLPKSKSK